MLPSNLANSKTKNIINHYCFIRNIDSNKFGFRRVSEENYDASWFMTILMRFFISFPYEIWTLLIFETIIPNFYELYKIFRIILTIRLNRIKILKNTRFLWISPLLLSKYVFMTIGKLNTVFQKTCSSIKRVSIWIGVFAFVFKFSKCYHEKLDEPQNRINVINITTKLFEKNKYPSIAPLLPLWLNENSIIWGIGLGCEQERIDQGRSYSDRYINISHCFFSRTLKYSGSGGVIYFLVNSYSMNLNYSMFYNCVCSQNGGAIYFGSSKFFIRNVCANSCSNGQYYHLYYGHFAYLSSSLSNQVEFLSVSNCSGKLDGVDSIRSELGNQSYGNTNSSMNNGYRGSSISFSTQSSSTISHCTFSNNKVSERICLEFISASGTISMSYTNIINNNSPSYGVVTVSGAGSRKMMYCIFKDNQNCLFYVSGGSIEVSHSFIDHALSSFSTSTSVTTDTNNTLTNQMTYQLQFFNSHYCNADTTFSTPLNTIEQILLGSPQPTLEMSTLKTIHLTPYRSFAEQSSHQTLFPAQTPIDSHFPVHSPHQTLFPEPTPHQTLFPIHTPHQSLFPEPTPYQTPFTEQTPYRTLFPKQTHHRTLFPEQTPHRTPFPEQTPYRTLFPEQTHHRTLFPEQTPYRTLYPEHTPHQSLFPIHTPYHTHHPERTNQRSFPLDYVERIPSTPNDQSNNNLNENKSNSVLLYSTFGMFMIIVVMISYSIVSQRKSNKNDISSSSFEMEKKQMREQNRNSGKNNSNENMRVQQMNHHDHHVSGPYVF